MAIRVSEARKGLIIRFEDELYQITRYDHVTPGNWRAIHHIYLKNLKTGRQKEVRMNTSDTIEPMFVELRKCQYLYREPLGHVFMDNENYEQFHLSEEVIGDGLFYIREGDLVDVLYVDSAPLNIQLPPSVVLEVKEAEQAIKGDTVSNLQKLAVLETGLEIKVPLHIKAGELVKVNTDGGVFVGRASE
jgi:elongation factor P